MKKTIIGMMCGLTLLVSSCSTPRNVTYFPDLTNGAELQAERVADIRVKPEDKLSIVVNTQDPSISGLFNLSASGAHGAQSNATTTGTSTGGSQSYYTVNRRGDINFPIVGKIHVEGLTREQVAETIVDELTRADLVKDPIVTVEYANTGISVMGEVKSPGRYEFNKDHLSIVEAIAMAGDLTINGVRDNILVLRKDREGKQTAYRVSLLDSRDLAASPVYYLQQDDVIYVEPNDKVVRETTPNGNTPYTPAFWVSMGSFAVTLATLIITLVR